MLLPVQNDLNACHIASNVGRILTDFKNTTLTSLYVIQNTVVCNIPLLR